MPNPPKKGRNNMSMPSTQEGRSNMPNLPKLSGNASAVLQILLKRGAHRRDNLRPALKSAGKGAVKNEHITLALRELAVHGLIKWKGREMGDAYFYASLEARERSGISKVELSL